MCAWSFIGFYKYFTDNEFEATLLGCNQEVWYWNFRDTRVSKLLQNCGMSPNSFISNFGMQPLLDAEVFLTTQGKDSLKQTTKT